MTSPSLNTLASGIAAEEGFDLCGVAPAREVEESEHFRKWVADGRAGEMKYLESRNEQGELKRASLQSAAPWARSAIVCALNYNSPGPLSSENPDPTRGWISRYAWFGRAQGKAQGKAQSKTKTKEAGAAAIRSKAERTDYHDAVLARLRRVEARLAERWPQPLRTWCYVDTGPVVERTLAKYAGIGWTGKNTCTIHPQLGSWLFLGVILTSAALAEDELPMPSADRCGSCTRCIEACPTDAITAPFQLDARRCISYLTIEKRGEIPEEFRAAMGRHVFGCDICQEVCPWNGAASAGKSVPYTRAAEFEVRPELVDPPLAWLANMSREQFNEVFRGTPIRRAKYEGLRRNAVVAMGNSGAREFVPLLQELCEREDANLAEHAQWALHRINNSK